MIPDPPFREKIEQALIEAGWSKSAPELASRWYGWCKPPTTMTHLYAHTAAEAVRMQLERDSEDQERVMRLVKEAGG